MNKYCANCGKEINEEADVCLNCGHKIKKSPVNNIQKTNIYGLIGFILSMLAFFTSFFVIGGFIAIGSLILSIVGLNTAKKLNEGKGYSIAGLVFSIVSLVISIIYWIIIFLLIIADLPNEDFANFPCERYGDSYKITNGNNVNGSYEHDEWFCCPEGWRKNLNTCIEL